MAGLEDWRAKEIDEALSCWRQGDVLLGTEFNFIHLADLSQPHSSASVLTAEQNDIKKQNMGITVVFDNVEGAVVLTQTCDIVRSCLKRPFMEVAPLVCLCPQLVEQIRRLWMPAFAYIPATAKSGLVADLDRVMTVEKSIVAEWTRTPGWVTDQEIRNFAQAISRKRSRFAFPDDFVRLAQSFLARIKGKHNRETDEARHLRALREIRVQAFPSWNHEIVKLNWWFIKDRDPDDCRPDWNNFVENWLERFDATGRFRTEYPIVCRLDNMTAQAYIESDRLDLDSLSVDRP